MAVLSGRFAGFLYRQRFLDSKQKMKQNLTRGEESETAKPALMKRILIVMMRMMVTRMMTTIMMTIMIMTTKMIIIIYHNINDSP